MLRSIFALTIGLSLSFATLVTAQTNSNLQFNYSSGSVFEAQNDRDFNLNSRSSKSVNNAYLYTAINTLVPAGLGYTAYTNGWEGIGATLLLYSTIVGPSTGNYYAKDWTVANTAVGLRTAAIGIFAMSQLSNTNQVNNGPEVILATATATFIGTSIYNIVKIPSSVERHNRRSRQSRQFNMGPSVDISTGTPIFTASLSF